MDAHTSIGTNETQRTWTLGAVSYLNTKPLVAGLGADDGIELIYDVPARLPALLDAGVVDAALVPVVDLLHEGRAWQIVSDACIGCDGETLTVRVFSRVPPQSITRLHVDGDSHTSVVLARIIWRELYSSTLQITPFHDDQTDDECEAVLLIGDKVVTCPGTSRLAGYDIETDLGSAWLSLTSLPFVFAVWAAPREAAVHELARRLSRARDLGVASAGTIAEEFAPGLGWPVEAAKQYLATRLKFKLGFRQRRGMERFLELAKEHDMIAADQELVFA